MSYHRRIISLSLNREQERELECAMDHFGTDSPTTMYRILIKRYIKDNGLNPEDVRYKTQEEVIRDAMGE